MKRVLLLFFIFFSQPGTSFGFTPGLVIKKIGQGTYVATDTDFYNSNTLILELKDGTVFIVSSPYDVIGSKNLLHWVKEKFAPKKIIAVNTHYHFDGTGGNQVFNPAGVETWSSELTKKLVKSDGHLVQQAAARSQTDKSLQARVAGITPTVALNSFKQKKGKIFQRGGETIEVIFPGHAHSPDNLVVYIKSRKLLFGGCMIKPGKSLGWMRDANVQNWARATIKLLNYDISTVVPGHGAVGGKDLLYQTIATAKRASGQP